jgi:phage terminase small subunit
MAQAKPGRLKTPLTIPKRTTEPVQPEGLTWNQLDAWRELTSCPFVTELDYSAIKEVLTLIRIRDQAEAELSTGVMIDDNRGSAKVSPAFRVWRDCSDRILKVKAELLATPKARLSAQAAAVEIPDDEPDELAGLAEPV